MRRSTWISCSLSLLVLVSAASAGGFGDFLRRQTTRRKAPTSATKAASNPGESSHLVRVDRLPTDLNSFLALRDRLASTPEGGAVMFVIAAHLYTKDQSLGHQAFAITMHQKMLEKTGRGYKGFEPQKSFRDWVKRLLKQPYAPASYVVGATPANGYSLPSGGLKFDTFVNPHSRLPDGSIKVFMRTSGADFPRPYTMAKNSKGIWKVSGGESGIYLGVKPPTGSPDGEPLGDGDDL